MSRLPVSEPFVATADEVQLADRILSMNTWAPSMVLTIDSAIDILRKNGLSYKEIREIWSMVDRNGVGKLTKDELCGMIRLMGWVKAGETLNVNLLTKAGPMPLIKGTQESFLYSVTPNPSSMELESDISGLLADIRRLDGIGGTSALKFWRNHNIHPLDLAKIWQKSAPKCATPLSLEIGPSDEGRLKTVEGLLRQRLAEQLSSPRTVVHDSTLTLPLPFNDAAKKSKPISPMCSPASTNAVPHRLLTPAHAISYDETCPNSIETVGHDNDIGIKSKGIEDKMNSTLQVPQHSHDHTEDRTSDRKRNATYGTEKRESDSIYLKENPPAVKFLDQEPKSLKTSLRLEANLAYVIDELERLRQLSASNQKRIIELETQILNQRTMTKTQAGQAGLALERRNESQYEHEGPQEYQYPVENETLAHDQVPANALRQTPDLLGIRSTPAKFFRSIDDKVMEQNSSSGSEITQPAFYAKPRKSYYVANPDSPENEEDEETPEVPDRAVEQAPDFLGDWSMLKEPSVADDSTVEQNSTPGFEATKPSLCSSTSSSAVSTPLLVPFLRPYLTDDSFLPPSESKSNDVIPPISLRENQSLRQEQHCKHGTVANTEEGYLPFETTLCEQFLDQGFLSLRKSNEKLRRHNQELKMELKKLERDTISCTKRLQERMAQQNGHLHAKLANSLAETKRAGVALSEQRELLRSSRAEACRARTEAERLRGVVQTMKKDFLGQVTLSMNRLDAMIKPPAYSAE